MEQAERPRLDMALYDAAILDMDGVITRSAGTHMAAWKKMFDDYLRERAGRLGEQFAPFTDEEYYQYVDGKPRYDGTQSFLESRGINLPFGGPDDPPGKETVCGLANRKNDYFRDHLKKYGVESYPATRDFVEQLEAGGKRVAAISSSRNAKAVLEAAGVLGLFHVIVDGVDATGLHLKGKPAPDIFLEAARRIGVSPGRAIVIEDAVAGVEAGKTGGFGLVIGINRSGKNEQLKNYADLVVSDLSEIGIDSGEGNEDDPGK